MKFQNPFFFCIILAITLFLYKREEGTQPQDQVKKTTTGMKLTVARGAFHYDRFEVTPTRLTYFPEENAQHPLKKYNLRSEVSLDQGETLKFVKQLENQGFWTLKNRYKTSGSCSSTLKVTLSMDGKTKTVICDDFERDCPALIKDIDKKVVEWERNDLKRVYLPG